MLKLYEHPLSPYSRKVKIALREKSLPFELAVPTGVGAGGADVTFLRANPRAEVPALVLEDGTGIFQSTIILDYIEERWPAPALLPEDPLIRAKGRMIEEIMDTQYEAVNWGIMELLVFRRAGEDKAADMLARAAEQLGGLNAWLARQLGDAPWFSGAHFGRADIAVQVHLRTSQTFGAAELENPVLVDWFERVSARPSVVQTTEEMAAAGGDISGLPEMVKAGLFKREYRDHRLEWMIRSGGLDIVIEGLENGSIRFGTEIS